MATKRELKREIVVLRNRVDELAARVAALEGKEAVLDTWPPAKLALSPGDEPWTIKVTPTNA